MSARSNEDRLGINTDLPEGANEGAAPPLKFITPTEFVELPSRGKFYPPNHPLHNQEVIEIKHMTTQEEDILTSTALLKNGIALDRMLESIIIDKRVNINSLLLGDKNALIISARAHAYGIQYDTEVTCPSCSALQDYAFNLDSLNYDFPTKELLQDLNISLTEAGTFLATLPKTDYVVELRLLTAEDDKYMNQLNDRKKKKNFPETPVSDLLRSIIVSVNGIYDNESLNNFIGTLPAMQTRYIRRIYNKIIPSLDLEHPFSCTHCNYEGVLEVPLNADFFWPNE